jgi:hypothetical protein
LGVAFVLDITSPRGHPHLFELVCAASEDNATLDPICHEGDLEPSFVDLGSLKSMNLLPPIAGQLCEYAAAWVADVGDPPIAPYLGNFWNDTTSTVGSRSPTRRRS